MKKSKFDIPANNEAGNESGHGLPTVPYVVHANLIESWFQALSRVFVGALIGSLLTIFYSQYQKNRDDLNQQFVIRKEVIHSLSNFIFERRERAVLLGSALKSKANLQDIRHRKRQYDEAYVGWNKNMTVNLVSIKSIVPAEDYALVENIFKGNLNDLFGIADNCLTSAYNAHFDGAPDSAQRSQEIVNNCKAFPALKVVYECGSRAIWTIDELARINLEAQRQTYLNPTSLKFWGFKTKKTDGKAMADSSLSNPPAAQAKKRKSRASDKLTMQCKLASSSNG